MKRVIAIVALLLIGCAATTSAQDTEWTRLDTPEGCNFENGSGAWYDTNEKQAYIVILCTGGLFYRAVP